MPARGGQRDRRRQRDPPPPAPRGPPAGLPTRGGAPTPPPHQTDSPAASQTAPGDRGSQTALTNHPAGREARRQAASHEGRPGHLLLPKECATLLVRTEDGVLSPYPPCRPSTRLRRWVGTHWFAPMRPYAVGWCLWGSTFAGDISGPYTGRPAAGAEWPPLHHASHVVFPVKGHPHGDSAASPHPLWETQRGHGPHAHTLCKGRRGSATLVCEG